jgi:hypothetical protein
MKEARRYERVRTFLGAQVIFNNNRSTLDCQIRNISPGGAKLVLSDSVALPSEFDVYIPQKASTYHAVLRWRLPGSAGIEFLRGEAGSAPGSEEELVASVRDLKSKNELLRERVRDLENENELLRKRMLELEKAN